MYEGLPLPADPNHLRMVCLDLSRRLQNALHVLSSQQTQLQRANGRTSPPRALRYQIAKNGALVRRKAQAAEAERFERCKLDAEQLHEDLRLAGIDHQISGAPREPLKNGRLRMKLEDVEGKLDAQKLLVSRVRKGLVYECLLHIYLSF
jgi:hypothetical protein